MKVGDDEQRLQRQRTAHPPPRSPQARGILGPQLAVGAVPQWARLRLHRLSAAARRRADLQRGLRVHGDGDLIPARVVEAPWLTRLQPVGEDVSLVLETANGTVRIDGETVLSTHDITDDEIPADRRSSWRMELPRAAAGRRALPVGRRQTFGMLERSSPMDKISR